ncbi:MAG TPA: tRNA (adenosine(37)-N6)-threonylcarbamoyltransferase complex transferase subunit TsaD [Bacteroidota bacterium]|nr:tRNA (adenosine(37)-N6)-threonylcarbamoyltransferase complex transferase subunit TsaD [Bacteroidota bacterium]
MNILGIETSCDETSAAVLQDGIVQSNVISSQLAHGEYGGVVPELASRAHQRLIVPVVEEALRTAGIGKNQLDAVCATYGPGLMGALLVGLNFAKALAYGLRVPFVGVNHMEAHLYSNFIDEPRPNLPFLCLTVSGGHTQLVLVRNILEHELLGETLDDAAGEAYDKVAKMLGLGFPGGPVLDRLAQSGNPEFVKFPRSMLGDESLDFSFSGIKTAVRYWLRDHTLRGDGESRVKDLCASFQAAMAEVLIEKILRALKRTGVNDVAIAGGVSANSELRRRMEALAASRNFRLFVPRLEYCTDNGAMIAMTGYLLLKKGIESAFDLHAEPNLPI